MRICQNSVFLVLVAFALVACSEPEPESTNSVGEAAIVEVGVWEIEAATITTQRRWAGRLTPLQIQTVNAPRDGSVITLDVRPGDQVEQGEILMRLSGPDVVARKSVLMERRDRLQEDLERWQRLAEVQAAGPAEVHEASLRLLEVEESLAEVDASLHAYVVRAPASGRIVDLTVGRGSNVTQGQELMRMEDATSLGLRLSMPARETVYLEDPERITVYDEQDRQVSIRRISYGDNAHPGFVDAQIYLEGVTDDRRRELILRYESDDEVLLVPWTAVANDGDEHWVSLVHGEPPRTERRRVELGRAHSAGLEVKDGLEAGDLVLQYEPRSVPEGREVDALRLEQ